MELVTALLKVYSSLIVIVVPESPTWPHLPLLARQQVMALDPSKAAVAWESDEVAPKTSTAVPGLRVVCATADRGSNASIGGQL